MKILKRIDDALERHKIKIFNWLFLMPYVLYLIAFFGIWYINPGYIRFVSAALQIYIALFLMYRFNPFRNHELRPNDDQIIFGSAFLLLANVGITSFFMNYVVNPIANVVTK
jgi:hypothetical protein